MESFYVAYLACLHLSANTSLWSQFVWHYQVLLLSLGPPFEKFPFLA
jgi:hypothetical protein